MLLCEPNFVSRDERERLCQLMFEVGAGWVGVGEGQGVEQGRHTGGSTVVLCLPAFCWGGLWLMVSAQRTAWAVAAGSPVPRWEGSFPPPPPPLLGPLFMCHPITQVFNVAGYYGSEEAVLSLYALGRLGGTVVDIGYEKIGSCLGSEWKVCVMGCTVRACGVVVAASGGKVGGHALALQQWLTPSPPIFHSLPSLPSSCRRLPDIVPVLEGAVQPSSAQRLPYGCQQLAAHLATQLAARGVDFSSLTGSSSSSSYAATAALDALARSVVRVAGSMEEAAAAPVEPSRHTLPDGQTITIEREGLALGEALMDGAQLGLDLPRLSQAVYTAASTGEKDARKVGCGGWVGGWAVAGGLGGMSPGWLGGWAAGVMAWGWCGALLLSP